MIHKFIIIIILCLIIIINNIIIQYKKHNKPRVAICFFGLCRSTKFTIDSINKNIYNSLDNLNFDYDVYLHTYSINKVYNNSWSGETNINIDNDNWKLLQPTYYLIENEDDVKKNIDFIKYRTHGNPWNSNTLNYDVLDNFILTLRSIYQVTQLWKKSNIKYDYIIYLRSDVLYLNPLIKDYFPKDKNTIVLPNFAEYPINDRFAIGTYDNMIVYGERYIHAYKYSLSHQLHSEQYLNSIINKYKKIKIPFYFCRIRVDGSNADSELLDKV